MSSFFAWLTRSSSAAGGNAPDSRNSSTPSRNSISVGIAWMPAAPASSCCASVSILPNTTSLWVSEAFSKTGANARQGPHHSAQKSRRTMPFFSIVSLKLSAVTSRVAMREAWPGLLAPASRAPRNRRSWRGAGARATFTNVAKLRISYNAPVVLTFAILAVVAFLLEQSSHTLQQWFVAYPALESPQSYAGLFTHILGHASWAHLLGSAGGAAFGFLGGTRARKKAAPASKAVI